MNPRAGPVIDGEHSFIAALRGIATHPAARGLQDDVAVLEIGSDKLVLTLDTLVEGIHFLPDDPPASVAWKLVAVNVSDLSAKGAQPAGCLTSHALGDPAWDAAFLAGMGVASNHFGMPLIGGDTVRMPAECPRSFSLTAIGRVSDGAPIPSRCGAQPGDVVWVSGSIGDAGLGLQILQSSIVQVGADVDALIERYRRPMPDPELGAAIVPLASAMMDISDGLMIDANRIAEASGVAITLEADAVPLSAAHIAIAGETLEARITAMSAGDDYVLLFTAAAQDSAYVRAAARMAGAKVHPVGRVTKGEGIALEWHGSPVPLPERLGYQH